LKSVPAALALRFNLSGRTCNCPNSGEQMHNADDCRQRSLQARTPADKANWLKIAEEWQKLAEEVDVANSPKDGLKAKAK
jgi:hypothetical protein